MLPPLDSLREVPGFPGYYTSVTGLVWWLHDSQNWGQLLSRDDGRGYRCVDLYIGGQKHTKKVHRVVYEAWFGPIPDGYHVDHIDHCKTSNRPGNLRLRKAAENSADCRKTSRQGMRVLRPDQRRMVAVLCLGNHSTKAIADLCGIGETTVRRIRKQARKIAQRAAR